MAEFITKCPHCNAELQAQDEWIGMEVECPLCKKTFTIINDTVVPAPVVQLYSISGIKQISKQKTEMFCRMIKENKAKSLAVASISFVLIVALFFIFNKEQEVDEKDLIFLNGKRYFQKMSNGAFSGVGIEKSDLGSVKKISHYKNGVPHGKTIEYDTWWVWQYNYKNGKKDGDCLHTYTASESLVATVKGQFKKGNEVGTWKYSRPKFEDTPSYTLTWSFNDNGELHGVCQTPLFPPRDAYLGVFPDSRDFFTHYPLARRFQATYAEAEFSNGARVSKGKLIKITPTGKRVEITY